jgi:hypothetical protein
MSNTETQPEESKLFEQYVYWTTKEIESYNMAIDDSIKKVRTFLDMMPGLYEPLIIQLESLKKEIKPDNTCEKIAENFKGIAESINQITEEHKTNH